MTDVDALVALPVRALTWLPYGLRPGVFLALVFVAFWFVVRRSGLTRGARAAMLAVAVLVDIALGMLVLVDVAVTARRRARGQGPGRLSLAAGPVVERGLDGAAAV